MRALQATACPPPGTVTHDIEAHIDDGMVDTRYCNPPAVNDTTGGQHNIGEAWKVCPTDGLGISNFVIPFELPALADDEIVISADFGVWFEWYNGATSPFPFALDLYGLPYRAASTIQAADYYVGPNDTSATKLAEDFITDGTARPGVVNSPSAADTAIVAYLAEQYANGAQAGDYVFFRLSPDESSIPQAWNTFYIDTANHGVASHRPLLSVTTQPCPGGQFGDCSGSCVGGSSAYEGDGSCDSPLQSNVDLMCPRYTYDSGDCAGSCAGAQVEDCSAACTDWATIEAALADDACDSAGPDLDCVEFAFDGADCLDVDDATCSGREVLDCSGNCFDPFDLASAYGDAICDDGSMGADLSCAPFDQDGADCCSGGTGFSDCDGNFVCGSSAALSSNGRCDSTMASSGANLMCATFAFEGGECAGHCAGTLGAASLPDCDLACLDWADWKPLIGDGVCHDGTVAGPGAVMGNLDCPSLAFDGGDCLVANPCPSRFTMPDCNDDCVDLDVLSFLGDGFCDDGAFGPPDFECALYSSDLDVRADADLNGVADGTADCP